MTPQLDRTVCVFTFTDLKPRPRPKDVMTEFLRSTALQNKVRCLRNVSSGAVVILIGLIGLSVHSHANPTRWWEGLTGESVNTGPGPQTGPTQTYSGPLTDLRKTAVPWRSDEMLYAIERAMQRYERIVAKGGWPAMPGNRMIRPGDSDERVPALRRILRVMGDYRKNQSGFFYSGQSLDGDLVEAVKRFQLRHGLRPSGRVDRPTLAALNVPARTRLDQLKQNHDRIAALLRMSPTDDRYVLVNSAAFQLEAVDRHQVELRHRVIVGRSGRETPRLRALIKAVNFFPHWKVPQSIAVLDIIPRVQREPNFLYDEGIRVVKGDFNGPEIPRESIDWRQVDSNLIRFKQDPGPKNALGLVRIDMQNPEGVYMHDTPLKNLFNQYLRNFSAGCVRVQDVFEVVEWLLRYEPEWGQRTQQQVQAVLNAGQPVDIALSRPVPVYFAYITGWAEPRGEVQFRFDIYGLDGKSSIAEAWEPEDRPSESSLQSLAP